MKTAHPRTKYNTVARGSEEGRNVQASGVRGWHPTPAMARILDMAKRQVASNPPDYDPNEEAGIL